MKEFDLFGFQVQIDEVATREWYEKAKVKIFIEMPLLEILTRDMRWHSCVS